MAEVIYPLIASLKQSSEQRHLCLIVLTEKVVILASGSMRTLGETDCGLPSL